MDTFSRGPPKDLFTKVWSQLAMQFQMRFFTAFPIGSYVKTMSANGSHLRLTSVLKGDHQRTISPKFSLNWPCSVRWEDFSLFFPEGPIILCVLMAAILDGPRVQQIKFRYTFERGPPKDNFPKVWSPLAMQLQTRRFFIVFFPIGSHIKTMLVDGCHL